MRAWSQIHPPTGKGCPIWRPTQKQYILSISLYSFFFVDPLEESLRLLDASPFKSATPSAASHSKAKVMIFSKKQQTHIFSFQKINSRRLAMAFPLRVFGYRQRTMRVLHRVFSCRHAVTAFPLQVFSCRQLATALLHGVERAAPGDDRILHGVEKCAPLDDEILHGVERYSPADNSFPTASLSLSPTCGEILHGVVESAQVCDGFTTRCRKECASRGERFYRCSRGRASPRQVYYTV